MSYLGTVVGHEPWVRLQGPGALLELPVWQGWGVLTSWSLLNCRGCSPGLEFSRELPLFIHLQLLCLDLHQLVLAQAKVPPSKSVLSSFRGVAILDQAQTFGRVQDLLRCLCSLLERVLQAVLHSGDFCDSSILQGTMSVLKALG